ETQQKIASILSSLDDKIELNNEMNKTLEEMAQTLFKRWFIDFEFPNEDGEPYRSSGGKMVGSELGEIPEGWEVEEIGEISDIQNGFAFKAPEYTKSGIKVLRTLNIGNNGYFENKNLVFLSEEYSKEKYNKYFFQKFDVALVMVGAGIGKIGMCLANTENSLQNQNMWRFRSNNKKLVPQLYLYFLVIEAQNKARNWANGSAREFYRKDSFSKINILVPSQNYLKMFDKYCNNIFEKISENICEIENLTQIRDILLPKLMSGEIEFSGKKNEQI
ncbi:MAG: restriction endonuclease subunit S, partial [Fusobacteriaceae bacterium]